ncbi:MAG: CPBP family intramembrane glutamic endopeptidase [Planctomycetota bacterium]
MTDHPPLSPRTRAIRLLEMAVLFFALPAVAAALVDPKQRFGAVFEAIGLDRVVELPVPLSGLVFPALFVFAGPMFVALLLSKRFPNRQLFNLRGLRFDAARMFSLLAIGPVVVYAIAVGLDALGELPEDGVFRLPRELPWLPFFILIGYPLISCYPQEISHRAFFFHRYGDALGPRWFAVLINALAFSWFHAPFWNPWALAMTFLGGFLFAWTWLRSKSMLAVTIEHALYGWWAFMTGAGWFVFAGSLNSN